MHTLFLQAVDSRYATQTELDDAGLTKDQYPPGWNIMAHQAATIQALRKGTAPIIINTAMTGDGKTLAGRLQLFNDKTWRTFAMYPTNELAIDQQRSLEELLYVKEKWMPPKGKPNYEVINSAKIDDYLSQKEVSLSRAEAMQNLLRSDYVMTNPDIFHLILSFAYRQYGAARDITLNSVSARYQLFVFDEFHLFGVAQISAVMLALLLLRRIKSEAKPPRFLFLSATPQELLQRMAERINISVEVIQGNYQHGLSKTPDGWRRILQPAQLHLYSGRLEDWIVAHMDDVILPFFDQYQPGAKGVIIANSIATAHRIYDFLKSYLEKHPAKNIRMEINTGITPVSERGRDFDLLVATSTVDVGVDFKINLLIFESMDAASHTQRLGRLGRHIESVEGHKFIHFEAHALLPVWVVEGMAAIYPNGTTVCREDYKQTLMEYFQPLQTFVPYVHQWAGIPAARVLHQLKNKIDIKQQYAHVVEPLKQECVTLFRHSMKKYYALEADNQHATIDAALSFRGSSPFMGLQVDAYKPHSEIVPYNLISLLLNAELEAIDMETLYQQAEQRGQSRKTLARSNPLAAYKRHGWLPKPRQLGLRLDTTLGEENYSTVIEQSGFRFDVLGIPELMRLNDELETRTLVTLLIPHQEPETLRRILRLGYQLELLRFQQGSITGSAAFGRDALLLDAVLYRYRQSDSPIIL